VLAGLQARAGKNLVVFAQASKSRLGENNKSLPQVFTAVVA